MHVKSPLAEAIILVTKFDARNPYWLVIPMTFRCVFPSHTLTHISCMVTTTWNKSTETHPITQMFGTTKHNYSNRRDRTSESCEFKAIPTQSIYCIVADETNEAPMASHVFDGIVCGWQCSRKNDYRSKNISTPLTEPVLNANFHNIALYVCPHIVLQLMRAMLFIGTM